MNLCPSIQGSRKQTLAIAGSLVTQLVNKMRTKSVRLCAWDLDRDGFWQREDSRRFLWRKALQGQVSHP